jgi:hypothetical protein
MGRRSRRRSNEEVQAELEPLAPGEVPRAVQVAAVVAALIALANPVLFAIGYEIRGEEPKLGGVVVLSVLMAIAAAFMWRAQYWAVLGFQALLALTCITAFLSLMVASNVEAGVRSTIVLLAAGTLFWFLVRAMARIQMPERPNRLSDHG